MIYFVPQTFVLAFAGDGEAFLTVLAFKLGGRNFRRQMPRERSARTRFKALVPGDVKVELTVSLATDALGRD
jgi:hypothetical protein